MAKLMPAIKSPADCFNRLCPVPPGPIDLGDGREMHVIDWHPDGTLKVIEDGGCAFLEVSMRCRVGIRDRPESALVLNPEGGTESMQS